MCCCLITGSGHFCVHSEEVAPAGVMCPGMCPRPSSSTLRFVVIICLLPEPCGYRHKLANSKTESLTFPSAPSSTPSRPTISFKLTAPADCLPPSNFISLGRTSQQKNAVVCTQKSYDRISCLRCHSRTDKNVRMGPGPQALPLSLPWGPSVTLLGQVRLSHPL